jgi:hypothetical protein
MQLLPIEKPHCKGNGEKRVNKLPPRRGEQWCGEWFCGICNPTRGTKSTQRTGTSRAACKFTVNVRQQSGRQLHVSEITFTRFTTLPHFPDLM